MTCVFCSISVNFLKFGTMSVKTLIHFEIVEDRLMKLKCSALLRSEMASFYPKQGRRRMFKYCLYEKYWSVYSGSDNLCIMN